MDAWYSTAALFRGHKRWWMPFLYAGCLYVGNFSLQICKLALYFGVGYVIIFFKEMFYAFDFYASDS